MGISGLVLFENISRDMVGRDEQLFCWILFAILHKEGGLRKESGWNICYDIACTCQVASRP
jgi:hypothetical protein